MPTAMQELLSQPVVLPSPYLEHVVAGFAQQVAEYKKVVAELEHALAAQGALRGPDGPGGPGAPGGVDVTEALPTVVANLHDYFTHVAAKLERVHNEVRGRGGRDCSGQRSEDGAARAVRWRRPLLAGAVGPPPPPGAPAAPPNRSSRLSRARTAPRCGSRASTATPLSARRRTPTSSPRRVPRRRRCCRRRPRRRPRPRRAAARPAAQHRSRCRRPRRRARASAAARLASARPSRARRASARPRAPPRSAAARPSPAAAAARAGGSALARTYGALGRV
jgi:hypothetical protein